jgi:hypothetical protein
MPVRSRSFRSRPAIHSRASRTFCSCSSSSGAKPGRITPPPPTVDGTSSQSASCRNAAVSAQTLRAASGRLQAGPASPGLICASACNDCRRATSSRGVMVTSSARLVRRSMSPIRRARSRKLARATGLSQNHWTACCRSRIASRSRRGWFSHVRSKRAPIGVQVWSRTAIRLWRRSPRPLSRSSRLRRAWASRTMKPSVL